MREVPLDVIELPKGRLLCVGTTRMVPGQDGGDHVRQAEIRLPPLELDSDRNRDGGSPTGRWDGLRSLQFEIWTRERQN